MITRDVRIEVDGDRVTVIDQQDGRYILNARISAAGSRVVLNVNTATAGVELLAVLPPGLVPGV